jgi:hypothetical protein
MKARLSLIATILGLLVPFMLVTASSAEGPDIVRLNAQGVDLQDCEQECRSIFGIDPYSQRWWGRDGSNKGIYYAYARCIQRCNNQYWKEYDSDTADVFE